MVNASSNLVKCTTAMEVGANGTCTTFVQSSSSSCTHTFSILLLSFIYLYINTLVFYPSFVYTTEIYPYIGGREGGREGGG